ncbi:MAG: 2Fe-2S iron-sulfur cluster-binding protein, partial [Sphingobacteriaceae bacterium]
TFRFKSRVWFTKPVDAHRDCPTCSGKVTLWYKGPDVIRVTARKDEYNEVKEFICDTCRFDTKKTDDWVIEQPSKISQESVIASNHYRDAQPPEVIKDNALLRAANVEQMARSEKLK